MCRFDSGVVSWCTLARHIGHSRPGSYTTSGSHRGPSSTGTSHPCTSSTGNGRSTTSTNKLEVHDIYERFNIQSLIVTWKMITFINSLRIDVCKMCLYYISLFTKRS